MSMLARLLSVGAMIAVAYGTKPHILLILADDVRVMSQRLSLSDSATTIQLFATPGEQLTSVQCTAADLTAWIWECGVDALSQQLQHAGGSDTKHGRPRG